MLAIAAIAVGVGAPGCKSTEDEGELLVSKTIGPEGGEIAGGGLSLTFPPGALMAETDIEIRSSKVDLTAADFKMDGIARALLPDGLSLQQPTKLTFSGSSAVLFQQDELKVAAVGDTGYINELGVVSAADAGTPRIGAVMPTLGASPEAAGAAIRDSAHFQLEVRDTPEMDLSMSLYDTDQVYDKPLNGAGVGECGFRLEASLTGGSLAGGCESGLVTATVRTTSQFVDFDIVPFLAGKLATPVTVGVVAGNEAIAYQLGFFAFDTSPCYDESCSGDGVCVANGSDATCDCNDGFAPEGLTCVCVPQCDGRTCGNDPNCDQGCGNCGDGEQCTDAGQCVPQEPDPDTGGDVGDTGMDGTTGMMDDTSGDGTTGDGTTGGESTGDPTTGGGSTSGMGSTGTG